MSRFIRLRGLPWSVTHKQILDFLENVNVVNGPKGILMVTSRWDGKNTGEAFVELQSEKDEKEAFKHNRAVLGHRYIEIFSASNEEVQSAMKKPGSAFSTVVKLRGLPYAVTEDQIEKFFFGLEIKPDREGILIVKDRRGRATGEAYVEFETQDDTEQALGRNREKIGHRYIEIFRSSNAEMRRQLLGNRTGPYDLKDRGGSRNHESFDGNKANIRARGFGFKNNINCQDDYSSEKSCLENEFGVRNPFSFITSNNVKSEFGLKNSCGFETNNFNCISSEFFNLKNCNFSNLATPIEFSDQTNNFGMTNNNNQNRSEIPNEFGFFNNFGNGRKLNNMDNFNHDNLIVNPIFNETCFSNDSRSNLGNAVSNELFGIIGRMKFKSEGQYKPVDAGHKYSDFFCVHMRGLPYNSFENDVFKFFDPIRPANVKIIFNNKGLHSGTADAIFETYEDAQLAMKRHMDQIGSRYIELFFDGKAKLNNGLSRRI